MRATWGVRIQSLGVQSVSVVFGWGAGFRGFMSLNPLGRRVACLGVLGKTSLGSRVLHLHACGSLPSDRLKDGGTHTV